MHPPIHLSISLHPFTCLSIYPFTYPSTDLLTHYAPTYPSIHSSSLCLLIPLSIYPPIYLAHHSSVYLSADLCTHPTIHSSPSLCPPTHLLSIFSFTLLALITVKSPMFSTVLGAHVFKCLCWRNENRTGPYPRALDSHLFPVSLQNRVLGIAFPPHLGKLAHAFPTVKHHKLYPAPSS